MKLIPLLNNKIKTCMTEYYSMEEKIMLYCGKLADYKYGNKYICEGCKQYVSKV